MPFIRGPLRGSAAIDTSCAPSLLQIIIFMNDGVYVNGEKLEDGDSDMQSTVYQALGLDQDHLSLAQKDYIDSVVKQAERLKKYGLSCGFFLSRQWRLSCVYRGSSVFDGVVSLYNLCA